MGLGFSFGAMPTPPMQPSAQAASEAIMASAEKPQGLAKDFELLARTAAVASQIGAGSSFFREVNTNRYFVSRTALLPTGRRDDDTFDKKRAKKIIRDLKVEATEASNDGLRGQK